MNNCSISPLAPDNLAEVFAFECAHRDYFASVLPPRPEGYFTWESFLSIQQEILADQAAGNCALYLLLDSEGEMIGRVNLSLIQGRNAEIGYRIAPDKQGRGYATQGVGLVCAEAFGTLGLHRLEAGAAPENIPSHRVLLANGFQPIGRARQVFQVEGIWQDSLLFDKVKGLDYNQFPLEKETDR